MEKKEEVVVVDGGPPYLPREIIIFILKRLPVKTLLRFRCVCKDWNILLKTPSFITQHLTHNTLHNDFLLPPTSLFLVRRLSLINHDLQLIQYHKVSSTIMVMGLVGSCNGLLFLRCIDYESIILWNPATRDILHAPPLETGLSAMFTQMWKYMLGFGFSATVIDYKIVRLCFDVSPDAIFVSAQVFSLSTGSWRELGEAGGTLDINAIPIGVTCFSFDGAIFWFGLRPKPHDLGTEKHCLISFDIATESFVLIPIPVPQTFDGLRGKSLTTHDNKLAMLSGGVVQPNGEMPTSESYSIDLWVMEKSEDDSGDEWMWTKIYTIIPYPHCPHIFRPHTLWRNQLFGEFEVDGTNGRQFVLCSLHLHTKELKIVARGGLTIGHGIQNYVESLVSLRNDHI